MKLIFSSLTVLLMVSTLAFAHEGAEHVMGTVTKVTADTIGVKTAAGETKQVMFDDKTVFSKAGETVKGSDLKEGDRVVIHAHEKSGTLHASTVNVGVKSGPQTSAKHAHR